MEFKKVKLGEISIITMGQSPKSEFYSEIDGTPFLQGNRTFQHIYPVIDTYTKKVTKLANANDILFSVRAPVGDINIAPVDLCIGRGLCAIRSINNNQEFLFYLLKSKINELESQATGTIFSSVNKKTLENFIVNIPNEKQQKNIGTILSNLDKKIELNQKIIANLQELSQTLFKRWFVDFEFPDENGNPYKSSGGEMVDSELGKIPKGWECVYLKDIVHHKKATFNPKKSNESEVKHFSLPAFDSGQYPTIDNVTDIKSNKWIIDENCILFSKMNPTTRRIWVTSYNENFLNVASSEFVVLKSDNSYRNAFIYNICISDKFNEYLVSNTTGSTNSRQRVKPDIAVQYRFAYNEEVSYLLSEKIEPYIEKIKIIREQNQNLTQLRDTLLPKLMSGEIEIPDDIEVNEDELSI